MPKVETESKLIQAALNRWLNGGEIERLRQARARPTRPLFNIILADPPWLYDNEQNDDPARGGSKYQKLTLADLCALPVRLLADPRNSVLLMWATAPKMIQALVLMNAWGFTLRTFAFVWLKANRNAVIEEQLVLDRAMPDVIIRGGLYSGMGHSTNQQMEFLLMGDKGSQFDYDGAEFVLLGKPPQSRIKRLSKSVKQAIIAPVGDHSAKPVEQYDRISQLYGSPQQVRCVELFARRQQPGWLAVGEEIDGQDIRDALPKIVLEHYTERNDSQ